jgi:predicted CXXCH cytochrome family protein
MKYIITLITILLINITSVSAEVASSFVDATSEFHKLDADLLKKDKNSDLCINCHILDNMTDSNSGWLRPKESIKGEVINIDNSKGEPDSFSKACLMCHDGNMASLVLNAPLSPCGLKSLVPVGPNGANHPVFMQYAHKPDLQNPSSTLNGNWNDAAKVSDLLRDEKLVCISCHIPHHSKERGFLRTSMRGSGLCMGCHIK